MLGSQLASQLADPWASSALPAQPVQSFGAVQDSEIWSKTVLVVQEGGQHSQAWRYGLMSDGDADWRHRLRQVQEYQDRQAPTRSVHCAVLR